MCRVRVERVPKLNGQGLKLDPNQLRTLVDALQEWKQYNGTDSWYYIPTFDDWVIIINYLKKKVPKYRTDRFDCENFADWFRVMVGDYFGINTMATVIGNWDGNRHGWSFFPDSKGNWWQMESQTGEIINYPDNEYKPDAITIG